LKNIWGNHGLYVSNAKHLVGNFNAHLSDVCFLFADEAFYSGTKSCLLYLFKVCPFSFFFLFEVLKILLLSIFDALSKKRLIILKAALSAFFEFFIIFRERIPIKLETFKKILPAKNFLGK
jgi:hypothetical protein